MKKSSLFNEENTVQDYIKNLLIKNNWQYVPANEFNRDINNPFVEDRLVEALIRLNPDIAKAPDKVDEILYQLRPLVLSVRQEGLVWANEEFFSWLRGDKTLPIGEDLEHVSIKLIDFKNIENNEFTITTEYKTQVKINNGTREDLVLLINGIPVSIGECKTPVRPSISWVDGAKQILGYENKVPELFVSNVFNFATEGKEFKYGTIRCPLDKWSNWRDFEGKYSDLSNIEYPIKEMFNHEVFLDILKSFIVFTTDDHKRIKIMCRSQQYDAVNKMVNRVVKGEVKKGLIWHFQGSGKSLLMLFASLKLRFDPKLKSPTVLVVVDRKDLDSQIAGTFSAADIPNMERLKKIKQLEEFLEKDTRKIGVTTIFRFKEAKRVLNERENIIVLVDEAHRTQEGDLGTRMRTALPNAFFFGLTGTPINKRDRNTFAAFGAEVDEDGYMSKYSFKDSIRDNATKKLKFEPRLVHHHVDKENMKKEFDKLTDTLDELEKNEIIKKAGKISTLTKSTERTAAICTDIAEHFKTMVEPQGFKGMVVCYDRECCINYKKELDKHFPEETSTIVMTVKNDDEDEYKKYNRSSEEEKKMLDDEFNKKDNPLKLLIVTAKLLTGFDAPVLQTMYLDKPLKEHNLLQAVCRTNRLYANKDFGLIVDYIGVFDQIGKALNFDEKSIKKVIEDLEGYKSEILIALQNCLKYFEGLDRSIEGYEGLMQAQECLKGNEIRDAFGADFSYLSKLWEAVSPNPVLAPHIDDYKWLSQVYESIKPSSGNGALVWHTLGPETMKIINNNISVLGIEDNLEELVIDEDLIEEASKRGDHKKIKEIEFKLSSRLKKNMGKNPKFKELGEKFEELKDKYEANFINSLIFLKELLKIAKEVLRAEKKVDNPKEERNAKSALTELFQDIKTDTTHAMVERIVNNIDEIVNVVKFPGWQNTTSGIKEIKKALRKTLAKYQLHKDKDLFEKAYGYIEEYY